MEKKLKQLVLLLKKHEGKNFDVNLQYERESNTGFGFMHTVKKGIVQVVNSNIVMVSEPQTANYFILPVVGIKSVLDESQGKYDIAITVKYLNSYRLFIQILEPY
ncbi:hypothetical protein SAMN04488137_2227 [Fictibacillus solisalsi]|uniref:Uncharacterized protein n=1 Tax=Fictibacillus solisalsi TaxID=459525 RepID=A0A1G9WKA5_9BACL|nr:hypothetical protein [Fictibacillus solisalsi]SDM84899.1 hypothetical protein SAMN04488137_2227 [Fictibacillus solisalsi]